ncbi:MAG TPA: YIP1 family protein [Gemmatimonadaceae bacterium]|nr:YIP1 family protein [Gemmatimonadaceae bacterium]
MTDGTISTAPSKSSVWEDFVDIFYQPSDVFDRRREGQFGLALLILTIAMAILTFALNNGLAPVMDAVMAKQQAAMLAKNPNLTAEQLSSMTGVMEKFSKFGAIIFVPIAAVLGAVLIWLIGKFVDAKMGFAAAIMISVYAGVPRLVQTVVTAVQGLLLPPEAITSPFSVSVGPARFLPDSANPAVATFLSGFDLFTLWTVVLTAIGVAVVARVPMKRAAIVAGIVWLVGLLPALYSAMQAS